MTIEIKAIQNRFLFSANSGAFDGESYASSGLDPNAPRYFISDTYFTKFNAPFQFRYITNTDEVFTVYYEGPQFIYADQLPGLKDVFKSALLEGRYTLQYTKSPKELLVAFYDTDKNNILFEGRPF